MGVGFSSVGISMIVSFPKWVYDLASAAVHVDVVSKVDGHFTCICSHCFNSACKLTLMLKCWMASETLEVSCPLRDALRFTATATTAEEVAAVLRSFEADSCEDASLLESLAGATLGEGLAVNTPGAAAKFRTLPE